jgi:hypothetical protein
MVITILLATSVVKLGFNLWKIEWHSLWDILMSEEKIRGEKVIGPKRPGLLFIYLGYVIWTLAQVIYAKTGKGWAVFEWESMMLFGFLFIGIPWVMYLLVKEVKGKLTEV